MTLMETLRTIHDLFQNEEFQQRAREVLQTIYGWLQNERIARSCMAKGWLPYHEVPFDQILTESVDDDSILEEKIDKYYKSHGNDILDSIRTAVDDYQVDAEAKETLLEALQVHQYGFYRSPPRLLLPEFERVIRKHLRINVGRNVPLNRRQIESGLQSRHLDDMADKAFDLNLFGIFFEHLFEYFEDLPSTAPANVPNRAATTHGWQKYSSEQASLNTIICADYLYRILPHASSNGKKKGN